MVANKYKLGDKVWLNASSRWANSFSHKKDSANPTHCYGTISSVHSDSYDIKWSNGENNGCYQDEDLLPHGDAVPAKPDSEVDLLAEAKRRYPIGTKFRSFEKPDTVRIVTLWHDAHSIIWKLQDGGKTVRSENGIGDNLGCSNPAIYKNGQWAEIVSDSSLTDDILAEAKRRFPIGTKYIPLSAIGIPHDTARSVERGPKFTNEAKTRIDCGLGYCYANGKWAEVVEDIPYIPTEAEVLAKYPKGTWYLPLKDGGGTGSKVFESEGIYERDENFIWVSNAATSGYVYDVERQKWADIVPAPEYSEISKDSILAEAKRRYPIGTRYIPIDSNGQKWEDSVKSVREATWYNRYGIDIGDGFCYYDGTWAGIDYSTPSEPDTIDSSEEQHRHEISAKFPPGTVFRPVYGDGKHSDTTYVVEADWKITCGMSSDSYWFNYPGGWSAHTAYIRVGEHEALVIGNAAVSAKDTDVRSERVKLLPEIEVTRKIII